MEHTSCLKFQNYHILNKILLIKFRKTTTYLVPYMLPKPMTLVTVLTKKQKYLENKVD